MKSAVKRPFKGSKVQTFKVLGFLVFSVVELLNPLNLEPAAAQTPPFYQGKTIRIIVGNLPGDTHDIFARAYSRHMGKHIPGFPNILVQNMPGAGGMIAANHVYNVAKPDGLTLGSPSPALYYAQLIGSSQAKFDWPKFNFIGAPERNGHLLFMRADSPYKTLDDIRKAKEPPKCAATGVGTSGHDVPKLFDEMIGLKFNLITGYPGGAEMDLAIERGEAICRAITIAAFFAREPFQSWYKTGVVRVMLQTSRQRNPRIPDVPTLFELMEQYKTPEIKRRQVLTYLGVGGFGAWPILATPGIPAERVAILRDGFGKTMKDADFLGEAKKAGWEIRPTNGETLQALAKEVIEQPPEVVDWLKKLLNK
ncbi:MAG: Bug family tripartite tricarboxylate transporter substrate binding protein [Candidatus Binatia bacterium]